MNHFFSASVGFFQPRSRRLGGSSLAGIVIGRAGKTTSVGLWHFVTASIIDCFTC
jgi:hypothetical protein